MLSSSRIRARRGEVNAPVARGVAQVLRRRVHARVDHVVAGLRVHLFAVGGCRRVNVRLVGTEASREEDEAELAEVADGLWPRRSEEQCRAHERQVFTIARGDGTNRHLQGQHVLLAEPARKHVSQVPVKRA